MSPPASPDDSLGQGQSSQSPTDTTNPKTAASPDVTDLPSHGMASEGGHPDLNNLIDPAQSERAVSHLIHDGTEELLSSISNDFFTTHDFQLADVDSSGLLPNNIFVMPQPDAFNPKEWQFDHVLSAMGAENLSPSCSSALWPARIEGPYDRFSQSSPSNNVMSSIPIDQVSSNCNNMTEAPRLSAFPSMGVDSFPLTTQIPTTITTSEGTLVRHYELYMSKFLSVKDPQWNLYTYMLLSPQGSSESPLRHSLLAWSAFHVSSMKESSVEEGIKYYHAASTSVDDLMKELTCFAETSISAVRLRMLLSATFFLCYCDIMSCQPDQFYSRIRRLKTSLFRSWTDVSAILSPITSRLLIWISYLEIRASLWGAKRSTPNAETPERLLLDELSDRVSLTSFYANSGSYLEECFGEEYPTSELKQDLQQEAGNLKLLDVMTILGQITTFQVWERDVFSDDNGTMKELRTTKIRLLHAELARIRAVSSPM